MSRCTLLNHVFGALLSSLEKVQRLDHLHAANFQTLVNVCRSNPSVIKNFSNEWLRWRVKYNGTKRQKILEALSAYHEFDIEKLRLAVAHTHYNSQKHQNDALDCLQMAYLCDPALHFVTCDGGYLSKIKVSPQKSRIHQTTVGILSDSSKAEELLRQIIGQ